MKKILGLTIALCFGLSTMVNAQNPKVEASVQTGTINVSATLYDDYTGVLTLPQDSQYVGHSLSVSMAVNGATGLGVSTGQTRSFSRTLDMTPYLKSYIGQLLTTSMVEELIPQLKSSLTDEQIASLISEYEENLTETKVNELIDDLTVTASMVDKVVPNPLTKTDITLLCSDFSVTLTGDTLTAYNNWENLSDALKAEFRTNLIAEINAKLTDDTVQSKLKDKLQALSFSTKKQLICDYIETLSADNKKNLVFDYIDGLDSDQKKTMIVDYVNSLSNKDLASLIDQVASAAGLNVRTLMTKASEALGLGTAWIGSFLDPIYAFNTTTAKVKVVSGNTQKEFTYTIAGDAPTSENGNTKITATPNSKDDAQAAWALFATHLQGTTAAEDSKVYITKGTYVQYGDQRLYFDKDLSLLDGGSNWSSVDAIKNNVTDIYADVLDAVSIQNTNMDITADSTYIISAFMPAGSSIQFGNSVLTLKDDCRIEFDAASIAGGADEAWTNQLTYVRNLILNASSKKEKVKLVAKYGIGMFTNLLKMADGDGKSFNVNIVFAPDLDVDRDGRIMKQDVPALVDNILGKDTEGKNNHDTDIDSNGNASQSVGDVTGLINTLNAADGYTTKPKNSN